MATPQEIHLAPLQRALVSLEAAFARPPANDLERDGAIQRFEYTFELCWKFIRRYLLAMGRSEVSASPRPLFRAALEEHLIQDVDPWFDLLEARNEVSHTYNQATAERVYEAAKSFPPLAAALLAELERRLAS
jgi:nucleotidyltransferase substrate binding protein (TIGR01987 family)